MSPVILQHLITVLQNVDATLKTLAHLEEVIYAADDPEWLHQQSQRFYALSRIAKRRSLEISQQQPCARCGVSFEDHYFDSRDCTEFVDPEDYTPEMKQEWENLVREARERDWEEDEWFSKEDYSNWLEDEQEAKDAILSSLLVEQRAAITGESYTLTVNHKHLGRKTFSMLESEWRVTFIQWRDSRELPVEVIAEFEQALNRAIRESNSR